MSAYTVSQLAHNAGVSVHIVRDYLVRGLLRPVACTTGGYGVFDDAALQRLCFVRAAFEAGIGLDALARGYFRSRASGSATPLRPSAWSFSHHARARDSCSRRLGAKLSGNIKARSLEPLPSRTMIVP